MSNLRLAFVMDVVDRATASITRIGQAVDRMAAPARRVRAALNGVLDSARMDRVRAAMSELSQRTGAVADWGRGMVGAGLAAGAAATAAGLGLKATIDQVDQMLDQAKKLNVPIEMYQRLGYAAQLNGSSQQEMGQALQFLSQNMVEALLGSKETALWFARLGISVDRLKKMNAVQVFEAMADKFAAVGDAGQNAEKKIAVMRALMGRSGAELKQTLDLGSAGLRKFYAEADKLGGVVSGQAAEAMGDFNDEWDRMMVAITGGSRAVASAALPAMDAIVKRVTAWATANQQLKAAKVADAVTGFLDRLPAIVDSLMQIGSALGTVIAIADRFAQAVGGWEVVIGAIAAVILTKGVVALYGMASAAWALVPAIWGVAAAFVATPFGMFVAGAAALAAAATLIYAKWEPIKRFFEDLWAPVSRVLDRLRGGGSMVGPASGAPSIYAGGDAWARYRAQQGGTAPSAMAAGAGRADVGGVLKIEIDASGQPRVRELRKAPGSGLDFDVYAGTVMVGP